MTRREIGWRLQDPERASWSGSALLRGLAETRGFAVADLFQEAYRGAVADVEFTALVAFAHASSLERRAAISSMLPPTSQLNICAPPEQQINGGMKERR